MSYHNDSIIFFQFKHKVFDLCGRNRVECGGRLVHQQHLGVGGEGAGDADTLLLAARHGERGLVQAVARFIPDGGAAQRGLDDLIELHAAADAVGARTVGDVVVDGHRERIGLLEHHTDATAQQIDVAAAVDVLAVEADVARDAAAFNEVVHAVERAQQGGLAAAGRADERGDLVGLDVEIDTMQGMKIAVVQVHVPDFDFIFTHVKPSFVLFMDGAKCAAFRKALRNFAVGFRTRGAQGREAADGLRFVFHGITSWSVCVRQTRRARSSRARRAAARQRWRSPRSCAAPRPRARTYEWRACGRTG